MNRWHVFAAGLALALGMSLLQPAHAGVTVYSDRATFLAATSGLSKTTIDFNGIAPADGFFYADTGSLSFPVPGVTFTGNGAMYVFDQGFYPGSYQGGGYLSSDYAPSGINVVTATLPGRVTAVGADFGGLFDGGTTTFAVTLSTGDPVSPDPATIQSIPGGSLAFFGVVSTSDIASITFGMPDADYYNAIDNFTFGSPAAPPTTPEPSTILVWSGLGALGLVMVWRKRKQVA
jgi:hypothetical protein